LLQAYTPFTCLYFHFPVLKLDVIKMVQINEFVKRARSAKIHAYIISHLKMEMPAMMGKAKVQQRLIDNLEDEFRKVSSFNFCFLILLSFLVTYYLLSSCKTGSKGVSSARW
jgi:hypothetical protein